ncbi:UV DNA damage repair endonuclease UvsE [Clostridium botulinum C]|uniref:UV DNA damage repair endonuclease UvsE n=2 Tax=Clostridium botulinum TaxID=1491 RepID=A0A9Q4XTR9_CLOBO|nr:UV DNA damage repair endonuclease UvsE [Clostridium botulinum]MCD3196023.1 UV DNA damage repair endonuclease UvsE [Clostridium botulinum C]MCD3201399.1 UV DNA damage repair endonuclease UvsE [Clostridium botulinum C]MCD3206847.1 UV DNA damage repair endonuclease UvsE [Clostridium botulinum C]MCD3209496.1 UV DNA damage repair endonuclease UvsE [Clostridium botulinum C]MCD3225693.1 UV DNA damage repair endonuclease UvsE [Clostridium botulinum C]
MKIGYACIPMTMNYGTNRGFILKNFNYERFYNCVKENLEDLYKILEENIKNHIYFFRISSDIIPFASHKINDIKWWKIFKNELDYIGRYIKYNNIRVSMHAGHYTVLNSPSQEVVVKSIADIEYHAKFLDSLSLDYTHKIVLHIGGVYNSKSEAINRFKNNFKKLSTSAKKRLILENDEKMYSIEDVLNLCNDINIPAVFDNLHHKFNPSLDNNLERIFEKVISTWKTEDGIPKIHYSDEDFLKKRGAHSNFVDIRNFLNYYEKIKKYDLDIMLEVKDKDISAIKCVKILESINIKNHYKDKLIIEDQWEKYKYLIIERKKEEYIKFFKKFSNSCDVISFYKFIDDILNLNINEENFKYTVNNLWKEFYEFKVNKVETNQVLKLINSDLNYKKIKEKLRKLSIKYDIENMKKSYYFYY